jgi:protein-disulfide isomerase
MRLATVAVLTAVLSIQTRASDQCLTQQQGVQILIELQRIRGLLESQAGQRTGLEPVPPSVTLDVSKAPAIGSTSAPVTVIEFTDYQCPFCQRFLSDVFPKFKKDYIDTGRVRFVIMNLPLDVHPDAMLAAEAAICAREHEAFWPMHNQLQANPEHLSMGDLLRYAEQVGLDRVEFNGCLQSAKYKDAIQAEILMAAAKGIRGTPTFVIGKSTPTEIKGDVVLGGSIAQIEQKVEAILH